MSTKIKKGDKVVVIAGKDKGKKGVVLKNLPAVGRVIVEGVNLVKKHFRRRSESEPGGIRQVPLPLDVTNVALYCSHCDKGIRYGTKVLEDKSKVRFCRRCQHEL